MALQRKGSRLITIEAHEYRWIVSPNDGWIEVVVEREDEPRQRLLARTDYGDVRDESGRNLGQQTKITPAFVRRAILSAIAAGWDPSAPGKDFTLDLKP